MPAARYQMRAQQTLQWQVPQTESHDDFVVSLALCARAASETGPPPQGSLISSTAYDVGVEW